MHCFILFLLSVFIRKPMCFVRESTKSLCNFLLRCAFQWQGKGHSNAIALIFQNILPQTYNLHATQKEDWLAYLFVCWRKFSSTELLEVGQVKQAYQSSSMLFLRKLLPCLVAVIYSHEATASANEANLTWFFEQFSWGQSKGCIFAVLGRASQHLENTQFQSVQVSPEAAIGKTTMLLKSDSV